MGEWTGCDEGMVLIRWVDEMSIVWIDIDEVGVHKMS